LTGKKAFTGDNDFAIMYKITNEDPASIQSIRNDLPEIFDDITKKALAKNPKERYQNCMALAYDLRVAYRSLKGAVEKEKAMELVEFLLHQPFFRDFSQDQMKELLDLSDIITARPGNVIVAEGEIDDTFYLLLNGKAKVRKNGGDIAIIDAGECFGEMAGIGGQPRVASVVADSHCMLMKISATLLDRSLESIQLLFYKKFATTLVKRLSQSIKTNS
jgi:serine/threonine-protein kinase